MGTDIGILIGARKCLLLVFRNKHITGGCLFCCSDGFRKLLAAAIFLSDHKAEQLFYVLKNRFFFELQPVSFRKYPYQTHMHLIGAPVFIK